MIRQKMETFEDTYIQRDEEKKIPTVLPEQLLRLSKFHEHKETKVWKVLMHGNIDRYNTICLQ